MAGVTTLDSRATGDGQEEEHTRKQGDNDNDDNVNDNDNDRLPATDTLPRTSNSVTPSHHKQIQPPRYVRSIPLGLQRANTLSSSSSGSPVKLKQQQHSSGNTATPTVSHSDIAVRPRRTSVPFPHSNEEQQHSKASNLPPRSESALGLSGTSTRSVVVPSASPTKLLPLSKSYNGPPDRKLQSLLFDYGDTSQVSELPSDPKTWTPSQLSIYVGT